MSHTSMGYADMFLFIAEQIRYNFYVPQIPGIVCGIPSKQVTPFPNIGKQ
jgi:hypothetical protein